MSDGIYRILYCSQNHMAGTVEEQMTEIRKILASSRKNNSACNITGALLFNAGYFAQVLEGAVADVEATFERIQRDARHSDVTVLEANAVAGRDFPEWSMAFAGQAATEAPELAELCLSQAGEDKAEAAKQVLGLLRTLVVQEDDYALTA